MHACARDVPVGPRGPRARRRSEMMHRPSRSRRDDNARCVAAHHHSDDAARCGAAHHHTVDGRPQPPSCSPPATSSHEYLSGEPLSDERVAGLVRRAESEAAPVTFDEAKIPATGSSCGSSTRRRRPAEGAAPLPHPEFPDGRWSAMPATFAADAQPRPRGRRRGVHAGCRRGLPQLDDLRGSIQIKLGRRFGWKPLRSCCRSRARAGSTSHTRQTRCASRAATAVGSLCTSARSADAARSGLRLAAAAACIAWRAAASPNPRRRPRLRPPRRPGMTAEYGFRNA